MKKDHHAVGLPQSDNFSQSCSRVIFLLAMGSFPYVNEYSKTKILAFCYWHN